MGSALAYLWNATRGHRLAPWRSPYIRWRLETYTGAHAEEIRAKDVFRFLWTEKRNLLRFLHWTAKLQKVARSRHL